MRVGPYELVASLGVGGMGEVYRARDTKLGRDVALKFLPEALAGDLDRLARFDREAQTLASLNHPNIAQVYGFDDGALVMELLEGETLADRLKTGPLPIRKAVEYGSQIARGLAAAHDRGIVHRDLKPDNVFVLRDGTLKIIDFGVARGPAPPASDATMAVATRGTEPGVVLGTVGYMAPEQVRGAEVDARADLFALGAVLYEMLAGRRAFTRPTTAETMTAILLNDPEELSAARADVSPALERIVRHCLEKNPVERFQTARDVAFALDALSGSASGAAAAFASTVARRGWATYERWIWGSIVALLALAAAWLAVTPERQQPAAPPAVYRALIALPEGVTFLGTIAPPTRLAISPDGRRVAFVGSREGKQSLWVQSTDQLQAQELSGTEGATGPLWSPDSERIVFSASGSMKRVDLNGGTPIAIGPAGYGGWSESGEIVSTSGPSE